MRKERELYYRQNRRDGIQRGKRDKIRLERPEFSDYPKRHRNQRRHARQNGKENRSAFILAEVFVVARRQTDEIISLGYIQKHNGDGYDYTEHSRYRAHARVF